MTHEALLAALIPLLRGALGLLVLLLIAYAFSMNRRAIDWRMVGLGLCAQVMFALGVHHVCVWNQPVFFMVLGAYCALSLIRGIYADLSLSVVSTSAPRQENFVRLLQATMRKRVGLLMGVVVSLCIYTGVLSSDLFREMLQKASSLFVSLINLSHQGTDFLFGSLANPSLGWGYVFAIQVLPNIIFFAALSSILYYLGLLQKLVHVLAYLLNKLNISGAESLSTAANIFLGQTEAPLMIKPYLNGLSRSEVLTVMVGGMANTAGSVLAAYVSFLGGQDALRQNYFALHMLSQSIMSAPAAIVCAKILLPEDKNKLLDKNLQIPQEKLGDNLLDAIAIGTGDGLRLAVNVGAMLVVFTALMHVLNALVVELSSWLHLNPLIAQLSGGRLQTLSLSSLLGYLFAPIAWLIGVPQADAVAIGQLLGEKTVLNEFVAYISLGKMMEAKQIVHQKSILIATYALCGFANFASIGIQVGGISQIAPAQRVHLTQLGLYALLGGTLACLMCGCIAGALF